MKKLLNILILFLLILGACITTRQNPVFLGGWKDKDYDFFETIEHNSSGDYLGEITSIKWGGMDIKDKYQWIRNPKNMIKFINTIEYIGLKKFISKKEYNEKLFEDDYWDFDWEGKSLNDICKTLICCYKDTLGQDKYYQEFWLRRKKEQNDKVVYKILNKIDKIYNSSIEKSHNKFVNYDTTLFKLLSFDINLNNADSIEKLSIIKDYFGYLIDLDINHSAYNLIFEMREYQDLRLNRDSLMNVLKPDTLAEDLYWKVRNDAKWIKSYKDNGP
ncbi:MAG: hypothetical protein JXA16_01460 [Bacteroidales bacterium]|nr:hypothetical protein [Bacteroidales bacterium]